MPFCYYISLSNNRKDVAKDENWEEEYKIKVK